MDNSEGQLVSLRSKGGQCTNCHSSHIDRYKDDRKAGGMVFFSPFGEPLLNPYTVLEIEFGASDDDIAKAYKKLMLQLHPDKQPADQSTEEAEEVSKRFHDVMGAKSFLLDGEHLASRREYDARLVAKEKANAAAAAQEAARAKMQAEQAARAKAQQQKQQQSAPPAPQSPTKAKTTKPTFNKVEPNKADDIKRHDTSSKPNITKKQWGKVSRPARRMDSSEPTKMERKGSGSTTSEDSSSDNERPESARISRLKKTASNDERKPPNIARTKHNNKEKKSPSSSSDKPCKDLRKDPSSSKKTPPKRSHAICSKGTKPSCTDKAISTKKTSNKGGNLTDRKSSSPKTKKISITESTKKQRSNSESDNHKLSTSCPSIFDDDEKKSRSASYVRKSSVGGKAQGNKSSKATPAWVQSPIKPTETTLKSAPAPKAHALSGFDTFQPAVETLTKQYQCPLTKEVMNEPMTDFEGNSYERDAILKYLETHSTSPVTGNPLCPLHLTANSALKERIKYTLKLKSCLDALTSKEKSSSTGGLVMNENNVQTSQQCHFKPLSLRQSVDMFIKEVNAAFPNGIINRLDSSGNASFIYKGRDYILQVPEGLSHNIIVQTWFDQDRKAAGIAARVVEWN
ncbi:hypothetical protein ACHAWT_005823, partial [Skeletonema menzelii]